MKRFENSADREKFVSRMIEAIAKRLSDTLPGAIQAVVRIRDDRAVGVDMPDEESLWITYDDHKDRFHVSGWYPRSKRDTNKQFPPWELWNPKAETPGISMSGQKSPAQLADGILRRFLPDYRAVLARCKERRDAHDAYIDNSNNLATALAAILGTDNSGAYGDTRAVERRHVSIDSQAFGFSGSVQTSEKTATFELRSVPADKALKLAEFLKTL